MEGQQIFQFLSSYGYWIIFPLMFIEGPTTTVFAGILSSLGAFNVWIVLIIAIIGDVLGDVGLYWIGKKWGFGFVRKIGKYIGITEKKVLRMEKFFKKHGGKTVFMAKSTIGLCLITFVSAGIAKMNFKIFLKYSVLGGLIWSSLLIAIGYFYGYLWREVMQYVEWIGWVVISLAITFIIIINFVKAKKARKVFGNNF
ncbi:MAG TPA: DedA family protein [Candidatus Moranbacteria bacterium]|nr:DedA family protein [Candidatus Moranbacteria bacterium]